MMIMKKGATQKDIDHVAEKLRSVGAEAHISKGVLKTVIGAIGDKESIRTLPLEAFPGVEKVIPILKPFKLVSREFRDEDTLIKVRDTTIGGDYFTIIAGPCAVENFKQLIETAKAVKKAGAKILRGGAFKPRTSPYSFQGLGEEGLKMLAEARELTSLPIITEVLDVRYVDMVAEYTDILQVGARNMQNFLLLTELGRINKPVLLKRSFSSTIEEMLMAAEYVVKSGNHQVILCERGIRTFETYTRNTLDISAIPLAKSLSHLPIMVDPSHASGKRDLIEPLTLAALAAGSNGVLVEVHPNPQEALCDGPQSLTFADFEKIAEKLINLASALNRKI